MGRSVLRGLPRLARERERSRARFRDPRGRGRSPRPRRNAQGASHLLPPHVDDAAARAFAVEGHPLVGDVMYAADADATGRHRWKEVVRTPGANERTMGTLVATPSR